MSQSQPHNLSGCAIKVNNTVNRDEGAYIYDPILTDIADGNLQNLSECSISISVEVEGFMRINLAV